MRILIFLGLFMSLFSCSSDGNDPDPQDPVDDEIMMDDDGGDMPDDGPVGAVSFETTANDTDFDAVEKEYNITVFTTSNGDELQIDVNSASGTVTETNLSQELTLVKQGFYRREVEGDWITFHTWPSDLTSISSHRKNLITNEIGIETDYCLLPSGENRAVSLYTGNQDKLVFIHSTFDIPITLEQYFVSIYDLNSGECKELALDPNPFSQQIGLGIQFQIISEDILALLYVTGVDIKPTVTLIDLNTAEILGGEIFDRFTYGSFLENSFLAVRNDSGFVFEEYSLNDFSLLGSSSATNLPGMVYGLYDREIVADQIPFNRFFNDLDAYRLQPAIYDLSRGEVIEGNEPFLEQLSEELMVTLGTQPIFPLYKVDVENRNVILGYDRNDGSNTGGIVFANFDGEVYRVVELDYLPEELIIRSIN